MILGAFALTALLWLVFADALGGLDG